MCVFTVELEVCDGFDNGIYTSASCAATLTLRSGSFFSVLNPTVKDSVTFPICSMSTERYQVVEMCAVPSVPREPNAIKL